MTADQW